MNEEQFGTAADYRGALETLQAEGMPENHLAMLRAHFSAPNHTTTWAQLAAAVGYVNGNAVRLQYGKFAERIARRLGQNEKPLDTYGNRWWLWVLVHWAKAPGPGGHAAFVLRRPVIEAVSSLGLGDRKPAKTIAVAELGVEGGGVIIYGRRDGDAWSFWQEGTSMCLDGNYQEDWRSWSSKPVSELVLALPENWWQMYPVRIHPDFSAEMHANYLAQVAGGELSSSELQSRWLDLLANQGIPGE